ncbi:hypothetical protein CP10881SC42_0276 [Chlamydia avium]|uniref:Uncharacterized protein n=1 Tax=Chlamydia avium TaxID=1457141 RepID=A0ABP2X7N5_9CHLA|nr:hypothetical protein CP10743SC13_0189 [Chlamydia psittaci 10_743_SC13]EPP38849.1 hypothetical protein CP10881SC42_0276 [Chlamydia avium]
MLNSDSKDCSFTISNFVSRYQNRVDSVLIFLFSYLAHHLSLALSSQR